MPLPQERLYTTNDIYTLPEGTRAELIDGRIYYMAPPSRKHQEIAGELFSIIRNYIVNKGGTTTSSSFWYHLFLYKEGEDKK